jgi:hypothetical protein
MTDLSKPVYMSVSFTNIPLAEAEGIRKAILDQISPGTSFSIHFDDAITTDEEEPSPEYIKDLTASLSWPNIVTSNHLLRPFKDNNR